MKLAELLTQLSAAATPGPWKADPKRLRLPVSDGSIVDGPIMGYLAGNQHAPEGMKVSLGSERIADHEFVAELVNAFRAGELRFARSETGTTEGYPGIAHDLETLRTALTEIAKGEGPFSRDPLEHAGNTIDAMKKLASEALRSVK
jgi:hypothetical protein